MTAPESPAGVLRRAAKLMRERAEAAPRGPWRTGVGVGGTGYPKLLCNDDGAFAIAEWQQGKWWPAAGAYIASMHPLVALAVAKLLGDRATDYDQLADSGYGITGAWFVAGADGGDEDPAITVARAYLGEVPS